VIVTVKLKLVTLPVEDAAVSVNTAGVEAPAFKVAPALSQLNVNTLLAPELHEEAAMLSEACWFPVFFKYTVRLTEAPGESVPQSNDEHCCVHDESLYKLKLMLPGDGDEDGPGV
jgi:hypothetical protein